MINDKERKILQLDLNGTSPVYTAYINDALIQIGYKAVISGINRNVRPDLKTAYTSGMDRSQYIRNKNIKNVFKFLEYVINWIHTLIIAPDFDAIHIQWLPLLQYNNIDLFFLNRLLTRNSNIGYEVHNIFPHDVSSKKLQKRFQELYVKIPKLIVHTNKSKKDLVNIFKIPETKITVMPLGPLYHEKADNEPASNDSNKTIGMIGVIRSYKGVEDTIEVLKILYKKDTNISLLLAGNGPSSYLKQLDERIEEYNLNSYVKRIYRFLPEDEMINLYKRCRVILAPYRDIEQSGAVTTALALGVPVVGYNVGGLPELIQNDYNGILVERDNIPELGLAVMRILNNNPIVMHKNCRQSMKNNSWEKNARILATCYNIKLL